MTDTRIKTANISKRYSRLLFDGITFELHKGKSLAITGPNGSGKSTLLKILCGYVTPTRGSVSVFLDEKKLDSRETFAISGILLPDSMPHAELTFQEQISCLPGETDFDYVDELIDAMNVYDMRRRRIGTFSSGEMQRAKIIFALCRDPEIIFLDEPSSFLDEEGTVRLHEILEKIRNRKIIIIATNDARDRKFCSEVIELV